MTTQKAIRATLEVGNIELDVFQMPDGTYGYGYDFLAAVIQKDKKILSDNKSIWGLFKLTKGIVPNGSVNPKVKVEGITYTYLTGDQLMLALAGAVELDPEPFLPLLVACAMEALERRADSAFGIQRSEQERNDRLKTRTQGKIARRYLTDSIADYLETHPELPDNYRKYIWSNCSDHLNLIILGAKAKQAKEFLEVPKNSLLRNHIPVAALNELERVEDLASRVIDEKGTEPLEAVKEAAILMFTKSIGVI